MTLFEAGPLALPLPIVRYYSFMGMVGNQGGCVAKDPDFDGIDPLVLIVRCSVEVNVR